MAGERTEKPTAKRRSEARGKGQVARSVEVNSALVLTATFGVLVTSGPSFWALLRQSMRDGMISVGHPDRVSVDGFGAIVEQWGRTAALLTLPLLAAAMVAGILGNVGQNRPGLFLGQLRPQFSRVSPIGGLKRLISAHAWMELVKGVVKVGIVGIVAFLVLWPELDRVVALGHATPRDVVSLAATLVLHLGLWVIGAVIALAVTDLVWQRRKHEKSLRMSKQEVKEEGRQQDIAPEIKSALRRRAMQMSRQRMLASVPSADVVITNPTHFAIALRYGKDVAAPRVVAKGPDLLAFRIREIAEQNGVAVVENPPLARALYREVEVGQEIPPAFFGAVAEVLAFVYRTSRRRLSWVS